MYNVVAFAAVHITKELTVVLGKDCTLCVYVAHPAFIFVLLQQKYKVYSILFTNYNWVELKSNLFLTTFELLDFARKRSEITTLRCSQTYRVGKRTRI